MPAKVKSAAALAKEAADAEAAAAARGGLEDSFEDAQDDVTTGISKDLLAYMIKVLQTCKESRQISKKVLL